MGWSQISRPSLMSVILSFSLLCWLWLLTLVSLSIEQLRHGDTEETSSSTDSSSSPNLSNSRPSKWPMPRRELQSNMPEMNLSWAGCRKLRPESNQADPLTYVLMLKHQQKIIWTRSRKRRALRTARDKGLNQWILLLLPTNTRKKINNHDIEKINQ